MYMNKIEELDELIERFLSGRMTEEEEESFKKELKQNPELKAHAHEITSLIMGMKRKHQKEDAKVISDTAKATHRKIVKYLLWPISIAAIFLLIFYPFANSGNKYDAIFNNYYVNYDSETMARGEEDSTTIVQLAKIFSDIKESKDCTKSIQDLENIYASIDTDYTYRAYANDISWYLSLAYIKDKQVDKAKEVLRKLIKDNPETEIADKAQKLLAEISDL